MIKAAMRKIFSENEPPERVALAFAVGVFIGFSPLLGLQTLLAVAVAVAFRLNKPAIITGAYLNNPWTIGPIVAASWWVGSWFTGSPRIELPQMTLAALQDAEFWRMLAGQWRQLLPFAVGATIFSILGAAIAYPVMIHLLRVYHRQYPQG